MNYGVKLKKTIGYLLAALMLAAVCMTGQVATAEAAVISIRPDVATAIPTAAAYLQNTVTDPTVGSIGGEWVILGLARSEYAVPQSYYDKYYENVVSVLQEQEGNLSSTKYTEYSRLILALTAIGKDVTNVGGYNLLEKLSDFDNVRKQGINGPIFALIALDSHDYEIPTVAEGGNQNSRQKMIEFILGRQLEDGGFSLGGTQADPDVTGMALQALAPYTDQAAVKLAVDKALAAMSEKQLASGGFMGTETWSGENLESTVQMLVCVLTLGLDPATEEAFIKDDKWLLSSLMEYYNADGSFCHLKDQGVNGMSSEQGFYAMVAYDRFLDNKTSLYDMSDVAITAQPTTQPTTPSEQSPATTWQNPFSDVSSAAWYYNDVRFVCENSLMNGVSSSSFAPNDAMTRGMLVTMLYRLQNQPSVTGESAFSDVRSADWYGAAVSWAAANGIVTGYSDGTFNPNGEITREELAAVIYRYADYTQLTITVDTANLAGFADRSSIGSWARDAVSFCCRSGFMGGVDATHIEPQGKASRSQVAAVFNRLVAYYAQ